MQNTIVDGTITGKNIGSTKDDKIVIDDVNKEGHDEENQIQSVAMPDVANNLIVNKIKFDQTASNDEISSEKHFDGISDDRELIINSNNAKQLLSELPTLTTWIADGRCALWLDPLSLVEVLETDMSDHLQREMILLVKDCCLLPISPEDKSQLLYGYHHYLSTSRGPGWNIVFGLDVSINIKALEGTFMNFIISSDIIVFIWRIY
ncbi:hypothetical protein GJ496_007424 [Pomphorhynchus laevis]|nr:hypothetical protein GJ496_007424 [Pomphorhynchus laevis]